jgi:hypothetical protein
MFEEIVAAVVHQGIARENKFVKEAAVDCLHSMLYFLSPLPVKNIILIQVPFSELVSCRSCRKSCPLSWTS